MPRRIAVLVLLIMTLPAIMLLLSACGSKKNTEQPQQVILEPGLTTTEPDIAEQPDTSITEEEPPATVEAGEEFIDLGAASERNDLMANKENIHSYYFEWTAIDDYGERFVRTWYKDGLMKIVNSFADGDENIIYFDCQDLIMVSYEPAIDDYGVIVPISADDPNIPKNHLDDDYLQYHATATDSINGQTCRVLENQQGERLWVSTMYGFPLQREYTDPQTGERIMAVYENLTFNQVEDEDVTIPSDLEIKLVDSQVI